MTATRTTMLEKKFSHKKFFEINVSECRPVYYDPENCVSINNVRVNEWRDSERECVCASVTVLVEYMVDRKKYVYVNKRMNEPTENRTMQKWTEYIAPTPRFPYRTVHGHLSLYIHNGILLKFSTTLNRKIDKWIHKIAHGIKLFGGEKIHTQTVDER